MVEGEGYKLEILEYAINQSIDRLLPNSSEDALNVILYRSNEVVWRVATEIYTKSGHQVDFIFIRDLLNLRIEPLRNKIAKEEKIRAELEAQKRIQEAEEARIRREQEAEEERIKAELEAQKLAEEAEIARKEKRERERKEKEQKKIQEFRKANPEVNIDNYEQLLALSEVCERLKNVIIDRLEVNREEINKEQIELESVLTTDLGVEDKYNSWCGYYERMELAMGIEDEFDIEISEEEQETILTLSVSQLLNLVMQKGGY